MNESRQARQDQGDHAIGLATVRLGFKDFLAVVKGLLVPDRPAVPGASRINISLFPRSRLRANPHLRVPKPRLPTPLKPGL